MSQPVEVAGLSRRLGAHPPIPKTVVKSAGRVLQIMEYFDDVQRAATVGEISSTLRYPQSSASLLLRSMLQMGYLRYDRATRSYCPTSRLALTGTWLSRHLVDGGPLLQTMQRLHAETGNGVILSMRQGIHMQYIHVVQAVSVVGHLVVGTQRHLTATGSGHVLLSMLPNAAVSRLVLAINADRRGTPVLPVAEALARVARIREQGHFFASSITIQGCASVAMPLRSRPAGDPMAIAVIGRSAAIEADQAKVLAAMRTALAGAGLAGAGFAERR